MSSNAKTAKRRMRVPSAPGVLLYWVVETILHYLSQLVWELLGAFRAVVMCWVQMSRRRRPRRAMVMKRPVQMRPPRRHRRWRARSACGDEMTKLCLVGVGRPNEWVLDSGASVHHTSNLELLLGGGDFQFQETTTAKDDTPPSRSGDVILGLGSVRTERFEFPGVRYVVVAGEEAAAVAGSNVVSVSQLARDHGLVTVFEPTSCHVKDKKTGQILGKGRLRSGMYMLESLRIVGGKVCARRDGTVDGGGGGGHGGQGSNGQVGEGHGGGGARDGMGGGAGARNQQEEEGSGSGAAGSGDVNNDEIKEEDKGSDEKEMKEIDGKEENEQDYKRGGQRRGRLMSQLFMVSIASATDCAWIAVLVFSTHEGAKFIDGKEIVLLAVTSAHTLSVFGVFLQLYNQSVMPYTTTTCKQIGSLFRGSSGNRECKQEETCGRYLEESSHQEKRLFGLSRFHGTTDPTGYRRRYLPAEAFPTSTNAARRREEFLVDSGASFHATWRESILFPYPQHLQNHTKPPTQSFGGIVGSITVTRSGYLNGDNIMLDGVLLAPQSRMNLVSVGQLSLQYGLKVEMDDEGVTIKKKWDGVQIGGGKMLNNHQYVLEYFQPAEGLFAHSPASHFKIFGRRRPSQ